MEDQFATIWQDEEHRLLQRELAAMRRDVSYGLQAMSYAARYTGEKVRRFTSAYGSTTTAEMRNRAKEKKIDKRRAANKAARKARRR